MCIFLTFTLFALHVLDTRPCLSVRKLKRNERKLQEMKMTEFEWVPYGNHSKSSRSLQFIHSDIYKFFAFLSFIFCWIQAEEQSSFTPQTLSGSAFPPWGFRKVEGSFARCSGGAQKCRIILITQLELNESLHLSKLLESQE